MKNVKSMKILAMALFSLFIYFGSAQATFILSTATDLVDTTAGQDLWQYTYTVSDHTFAKDTGFTINFDPNAYGAIDPSPSSPNADWNVLTWDPDPAIPGDGAYDAYASTDNASLADPFAVSFVWLGAGTPGPQIFEIYDGITWDRIESGETESSVPVPASLILLSTGLISLAGFRRNANQEPQKK